MRKLSEHEVLLARFVVKQYYEVIPKEFKTFCVFNASVLTKVFEHYGLDTEVIPCQTMLSQPKSSTVIGFVGSNVGKGGWDGHAVCRVGNYFIDMTLSHFSDALGVNKVEYAMFEQFRVESNLLGRFDVSETTRIWWVKPPQGINASPPNDDPHSIKKHAKSLIEHIDTFLKPSLKQILQIVFRKYFVFVRSIFSRKVLNQGLVSVH